MFIDNNAFVSLVDKYKVLLRAYQRIKSTILLVNEWMDKLYVF